MCPRGRRRGGIPCSGLHGEAPLKRGALYSGGGGEGGAWGGRGLVIVRSLLLLIHASDRRDGSGIGVGIRRIF